MAVRCRSGALFTTGIAAVARIIACLWIHTILFRRTAHALRAATAATAARLRQSRWTSSSSLESANELLLLRADMMLKSSPQPSSSQLNQSSRIAPIGLYVHIPYCRRRCRYCDFAIVPIGSHVDTETPAEVMIDPTATTTTMPTSNGFVAMNERYTNAVLSEIGLWQHQIAQQQLAPDHEKEHASLSSSMVYGQKVCLQSIYFGGGTPSLAPIETLRRILAGILNDGNSPFVIDRDQCEITIEADPGTFSLAKLQAFREMGFNRLSLGVQSFDDAVLAAIGRVHRSRDVYEAIDMIQAVYGDEANYSIDLISGLPGVSLADWTETLQTALTALQPRPTHVSIYDLQIEKGTVFGKWYDEQDDDAVTPFFSVESTRSDLVVTEDMRRSLPSAQDSAFMYKYAAGYLRAKGYEHYEVSSYARVPHRRDDAAFATQTVGRNANDGGEVQKSYRSQHNQIYWALNGQWFAIGLGATSFINGRTVARPRALADYQRWVEAKVAGGVGIDDATSGKVESSSDVDFLTDTVLKRLRTIEGLSMDWVRDRYGAAYTDAILRGSQLGIDLSLACVDRDTNMLRLQDPDGFLFSNSIIASIFVELERVSSRKGAHKESTAEALPGAVP